MTIKCGVCGEALEADIELEEGQHVICPYCNSKFSYHEPVPVLKPARAMKPAHRQASARNVGRMRRTTSEPAVMQSRIDIGSIFRALIIITILICGGVFLYKQYEKFEKQKAIENQRIQEENRMRRARAEAERKAAEEEWKREKKEREEERRRERKEIAERRRRIYDAWEARLKVPHQGSSDSKDEAEAIKRRQQYLREAEERRED